MAPCSLSLTADLVDAPSTGPSQAAPDLSSPKSVMCFTFSRSEYSRRRSSSASVSLRSALEDLPLPKSVSHRQAFHCHIFPSPVAEVIYAVLRLSSAILVLDAYRVYRETKPQQEAFSRGSPDEFSQHVYTRTVVLLSSILSSGKELSSLNPQSSNLPYVSISKHIRIWFIRSLRYQVLVFMDIFVLEVVNTRIRLFIMFVGSDGSSMVWADVLRQLDQVGYCHFWFYSIPQSFYFLSILFTRLKYVQLDQVLRYHCLVFVDFVKSEINSIRASLSFMRGGCKGDQNPQTYIVLYPSTLYVNQCQIEQALRYHGLVFLFLGAFVVVWNRVILVPKLGGCDELIMIYECSYKLQIFTRGVHLSFWITSRVLIKMTVWKLLLFPTDSPIDVSCLQISSQTSSCRDQERSKLPYSFVEHLILFWRVSFPLVSKPKRNLNYLTALLSYAMIFSGSEEATVISLLRTEVTDQFSKSRVTLTPFKLVEEAVEDFKSFKCLTTLNCFTLLLTFFQAMCSLLILCFVILGHFFTIVVAHLDMSDVAFSFVTA